MKESGDAEMGESVASIIAAEVARLRETAARFPVAQAVLTLRQRGIDSDDEVVAAIARAFDRNPAEVRRLVAWSEALFLAAGCRRVLHRCVSISCTANGASALWAEVGPILESAGLPLEIIDVHCLGQCEQGPSLGHADSVYTGQAERVIVDDRPWRESPFSRET